jgi:tetratricopeptide (TPR) repeat protein
MSNILHILGNNAFKKKDYNLAILYYTCIINLFINYDKLYIIYSNRSACNLSLKNYNLALKDGLECIKLNKMYSIGLGRIGSAFKGLNKMIFAYDTFEKAVILSPSNKNYKNELIKLKKYTNIDKSNIFNIILKDNNLLNNLKELKNDITNKNKINKIVIDIMNKL